MSYTLSSLKTAIQDYTENQETTFVNNLNNFIKSCEERIFKSVDLALFKKNASGTLSTGNKYLSVPTDFLTAYSLSYTDGDSNVNFLMQKELSFLQEYAPNASTTAAPKYYAYFNVDNFIVSPTPDDNYAVELQYYYRPTSLTAGGDSGTTWLSENAPQTMLYGSLVEAYTFMKGEADMLQAYNQQFMEGLARLKNLGEGLEETDTYRSGSVRRERT